MNSRKFTVLLFIFISTILMPNSVYAFSGSGSGTYSNPYIITKPNQLKEVNDNLSAYYKLGNDIDMSGVSFNGIGGSGSEAFRGDFNGAGYTIKNMSINKTTTYAGLFNFIRTADVRNLKLENVYVNGTKSVGGIVGYSDDGYIYNCSVSGKVIGNYGVGGIVGTSWDTIISESYSKVDIAEGQSIIEGFGGIIGVMNDSSVGRSYYMGNMNVKSSEAVGGIAGTLNGTIQITDCFAIADIQANRYAGGIAGYDFGDAGRNSEIEDCYFSGTISASRNYDPITPSNVYVSGVYFNSDTTGWTTPTSRAKTTVQLKKQSTYSGWSFNKIWMMDEDACFPMLQGLDIPALVDAPTVKSDTITANSIKLTWNAIPGAKTYEIMYGNKTVTSSVNSVTVTGLAANTSYSFQVRVKNTASLGVWSKAVSVKTLQNLAVPVNISAKEVTPVAVSLGWDKVDSASGYEVYHNGKDIAATVNSLIIEDLVPDTEYIFKVRSVSGTQKSNYSSEVKFRTKPMPEMINLAYETEGNDVKILWEEAQYAEAYEIDINGEITEITEIEYTLKNIEYNKEYTIKVRTKIKDYYGAWSEELTVLLELNSLNVPENLTAISSYNKITLRWDAVAGAKKYVISYEGKEIETENNYVTITDLNEETEYSFFIQAQNDTDISEKAEIKATTTKAPELSGLYDELTFNIEKDKIYSLSLSAENFEKFNELYLILEYNEGELVLLDFAAQTSKKDLSTGKVDGTEIEIISIELGKVVFKIDRSIPEEKMWSGMLTILEFKAKTTGETTIIFQ